MNTPGPIEGLVIIEPRVYADDRGFFMESFKARDFAAAGIRWNDPDLAITWPIKDVLISPKDARLPYLKDII